jgi:hypothetical protein
MKKILVGTAIVFLIAGCNSNDKKKAIDEKTDNQAGVENVNGNIPDTSNAINLNTHKKDSSGTHADSAK